MSDKPTYEELERRIRELEHVDPKRKRGGKASQDREEWLGAMFQSTTDCVFLKDTELLYVMANPPMERFLGRTSKDLIGRTDVELFGAEAARHAGEMDARVLRGETVEADVTKLINNKPRTFHFKKTPVLNSDSRVVGIGGIALDVTERRRAEEELRQVKERTEIILQNIQSGVFVLDAKTHNIIDVNPAAEVMIGAKRDEIIGHVCHKFVCKSAQNECPITDKGQRVNNKETVLLKKDGGQIDILKTVIPIAMDGRELLLESFVDISYRKQAEEAARAHQERFKIFFSSVNDAIFVHPLQEEGFAPFIEVNDIACKRYGYSRDEFHKLTAVDITKKRDAKTHAAPNHRRKLLEKMHLFFESVHIKKSGEEFPVEINSNIVEQFGKPVILAVVRDITQRKQVEEEKATLELQLQKAQKMEAIGTLAGGIAHDFNNILAAVFGYTELALSEAEKESTLYQNLQEVFQASSRARDLIKQILAFSRQSEKGSKAVQIKLICKETINFLRASLPTSITIRHDIKSESLVMADPTQIHQVLMNLCTNAGYAMGDKGGVLELKLTDVKLGADLTTKYPDLNPGPYIELTVSDTGHGIPAHIINKIFDPFFTTKGKGEGTGMGLSVVHGIVGSCGGTITVSSEPGKGAAFKVYLPAVERDRTQVATTEKPIATGTERILLVDDEGAIVDIGKQMLESLGYKITTRTSSIEALGLFQARPNSFDLVITDMTMPKMTGEDLARELIRIRPDIPVILCTGYSARINEQQAMAMGIRAFVLKPVVKLQIATAIRKVLDGE